MNIGVNQFARIWLKWLLAPEHRAAFLIPGMGCRLDATSCQPQGSTRPDPLAHCALCPQRQPRPAPNQVDCRVCPPRYGQARTRHHHHDARRGLTAPDPTRPVGLPKSSRFCCFGGLRRPQAPPPEAWPLDTFTARAGHHAGAPFPQGAERQVWEIL